MGGQMRLVEIVEIGKQQIAVEPELVLTKIDAASSSDLTHKDYEAAKCAASLLQVSLTYQHRLALS